MNVIDILRTIGYDIISVNNETGHYRVSLSPERRRRSMKVVDENKGEFDYDLFGKFDLYVSEVKFNGVGDLYVEFREVQHPEDIWDCYEYKNMEPNELY